MGNLCSSCLSIIEEQEEKFDYEKKYLYKFDVMETNPLYNKLEDYYIIENTPLGNVIMFYDLDNKSFNYYSDKLIPNKYLEVVSRRYVISNNSKIIYHSDENEDEVKKDDNVNKLPDVYGNVKLLPKIKETKSCINKYNYKGKISEFKIIKKNTIQKKEISYEDYIKNI